jgi:hypothetical protein
LEPKLLGRSPLLLPITKRASKFDSFQCFYEIISAALKRHHLLAAAAPHGQLNSPTYKGWPNGFTQPREIAGEPKSSAQILLQREVWDKVWLVGLGASFIENPKEPIKVHNTQHPISLIIIDLNYAHNILIN